MRLNGARGAALLIGGAYAFARGLAYLPLGGLPDPLPRGLELISVIVPIDVWGALWVVTAIICAANAFRKSDSTGWGALVGMMTAWGVAYGYGWAEAIATGAESRAWLNVTAYLGPAIIIGVLSVHDAKRRDRE